MQDSCHRAASWLLLLLALALLQQTQPAASYHSGAPAHRCSNLVPMHRGEPPQMSPPPFEFRLQRSEYSPGDRLVVTLRGTDGNQFKGFAISARRLNGDTEEMVGTFRAVTRDAAGRSWYSATEGSANCATHSSGNDKAEVQVEWLAPSRSVGDIVFMSPVVQQLRRFWTNVTSSTVRARVASQDPPFPPLRVGSERRMSGSCGSDFGCVSAPAGCGVDAGCDVQLKFALTDDRTQLRMEAQAAGEYLSVGFSDDDKMRDDLTISCTSEDRLSIQIGYNVPVRYRNEQHRATLLSDKSIEAVDGKIWCQFTVPPTIRLLTYSDNRREVNRTARLFDLTKPHFVFLAYGRVHRDSISMRKHGELPAISSGKVSLVSRDHYNAYRISGHAKAHGSLMIFAWLILAPVAINLAYFYRLLFLTEVKGVQLWFHLHRAFAVSAPLLSLIALLVILAGLGWQWPSQSGATQTHAVMGAIVLGLGVCQIAAGLLRPDKGSQWRPLFKLFHGVAGSVTSGLANGAYATIGFLSTLPAAYRTRHIAVAFVWIGFNAIFMTAMGCATYKWEKDASEKEDEQRDVRRRRIMWLLLAGYVTGCGTMALAGFVSLMLY